MYCVSFVLLLLTTKDLFERKGRLAVLFLEKKMTSTRRKGGMQFVRFGVPFLGFAVFGSLGLSTMLRGRLDIDDAKREVNDFRAPADVQKKRERRRKEDEKKGEMLLRCEDEAFYEMKKVPRPKGSWW